MAQTIKTVGIISPGDMGHQVGRVLRHYGLRVITSLDGRSERTRTLAAQAGIEAVGDYAALVREADIVLSILVPSEAVAAAERIAQAADDMGVDLLFVDCNAIAPQTVRQIEEIIQRAGGCFVDASIIGPPPRLSPAASGQTRFYASGEYAVAFAGLGSCGLNVIVLDGPAGQASALKMCYAALTKGLTALCTELLTAAEALGVGEALAVEFQQSQSAMLAQMNRAIPGMTPKAHRWVGEMEEIAATFAAVGLTPKIFAGAADIYRLVAASPLGERALEDTSAPPSAAEAAAILAQFAERYPSARRVQSVR
jgi:3-hydroxyisobutyrate dehydrogenase-like beta-hydroxyacid dehydrogenase